MIYEENIIQKKPMKVDIRFASVYPNIYKTAMSSLGYQIVYGLVNEREDSWCERVIYPNTRSIESNSPLKDFDIIAFSLQYEEDYFNVLELLKKADIPIKKEERQIKERQNSSNSYPLIIAGGPCASSNPLPLSDFIDVFIIGEAEAILDEFLNKYKELTHPSANLNKFSSIKGIYIPDYPGEIAITQDMNDAYFTTQPIITKTTNPKEDKDDLPVFGNSILLNVSRGCLRNCRFCMSGYLYRPIRETPLNKLFEIAEKTRENTGKNKVSLIGAAVSDYSKINELTTGLLKRGFQISTPSLRIESITKESLIALKESGGKTITIAPESIYKLRKSLNKDISDEKIEEVIKNALKLDLNIKLYFLIGIPNETQEDIEELAIYIKYLDSLKSKVESKFKFKFNSNTNTNTNANTNNTNNTNNNNTNNNNTNSNSNKNSVKSSSIKFSVNPLIPKPHTPLQWEGYDLKDIKTKTRYLKSKLKNIAINFHSPKMGLIQYVLSCKGREVGKLLEKSLEKRIGIREWEKYSSGYDLEDELPWKNIDIHLNENFLKKEYENLKKGKTTPWCVENPCYNCRSCNK